MWGDLGKLFAAKGFKKLPKVQKIAESGNTALVPCPFGGGHVRPKLHPSVDPRRLCINNCTKCQVSLQRGREEDQILRADIQHLGPMP